MENRITFEEISKLESGNATLWHYGTAQVQGLKYDFTLAEMVDNNWSSFEVTWVDSVPYGHTEIEKQIIGEYEISKIS